MTRKDYIAIATLLRNSDEIIDGYALEALAEMFADMLAEDNPRFNRERFLASALMTSAKREAILSQLN